MAAREEVSPDSQKLPRRIALAALIIIALGMAASAYLTIAHYTTPATLACPEKGIINCTKVTTSTYSEILGVPLAVLGLLFYLGNLPLHLPAAWRSPNLFIRRLRLVASGTGILVVFWLLYVELFRLNAICLYCSSVHVLTISLFILTIFGTALTSDA